MRPLGVEGHSSYTVILHEEYKVKDVTKNMGNFSSLPGVNLAALYLILFCNYPFLKSNVYLYCLTHHLKIVY